ncbi:hypothetical protein SAMN05428945_5007 [Streptomyces sp. 2224.1]|nr:hypothetical protein BX261_0326 [Streptomyces sp. 2321.6]SDR58346.1 hypothetical protein SAMN05216511_6893 [Streptomyces sp. KS_16]SED47555.1 hypothetical protein SAMN05428945_5007 [Streptomyces sp. 2224.1]
MKAAGSAPGCEVRCRAEIDKVGATVCGENGEHLLALGGTTNHDHATLKIQLRRNA